ncbi:hypothetical protein P8F81_23345 (plasmid) [Kosakonia cowanii]|jgi:putative virulence related protein PagC|uniref:outer membrane beta-barrel protein n=1 Tax=Kosakonia cowanii TaxID=208223 RepID=UPI002DDD37BB|nr:outer membrane beta-barrel protein [Kosakonia cowanii]WRY61886.1 hypothetical protein P8F81_23345 [Kosakonia cowanii]
MKKEIAKLLLGMTLLATFTASANDTLSLNYSYGNLPDKKGMPGLTVQYMHVPDSLGFTTSATFLRKTYDENIVSKYASLLAGPVYKLNSTLYIFGMAGISASSKMKDSQANELYGPAISAGVGISLSDKLGINVGYQTSHNDGGSLNVFYGGLGYSF